MKQKASLTRSRSRAASSMMMLRDRRMSFSFKGPIPLDDDNTLPVDWDELVDSDGNKFYINHQTKTITRKHPIASEGKADGKKALVQIFTMLGTPTDLSIVCFTESRKFLRIYFRIRNMEQK